MKHQRQLRLTVFTAFGELVATGILLTMPLTKRHDTSVVVPVASNRQGAHKWISDEVSATTSLLMALGMVWSKSGSFVMEGKSPICINPGLIADIVSV